MRLVDAEELEKATCGRCKESKDGRWSTDCLWISCKWGDVMPVIQKLPIVDAQPVKHGRWSECWRDPARNVISVICSACEGASLTYLTKRDLAVDDVPKKICIQMTYCPKCGAKMEGDKDG